MGKALGARRGKAGVCIVTVCNRIGESQSASFSLYIEAGGRQYRPGSVLWGGRAGEGPREGAPARREAEGHRQNAWGKHLAAEGRLVSAEKGCGGYKNQTLAGGVRLRSRAPA